MQELEAQYAALPAPERSCVVHGDADNTGSDASGRDDSAAPTREASAPPATCPAGSINNNHVDSASYFNLAATYKIMKSLQLFARIDNVFNKAPPIAPSAGSATNPALFDTLGTTYKVGVRLQY